ncbi:MAG: Smr/MutS family protein [Alphaproteobacteria bacterium]
MNAGRSGKSGGADRSGKPDTTDEDDALLWKRIAETTKPLPGRSVKLPAARAKQRATKTSAPAPAPPQPAPNAPPKPPKPPELRPGDAKGLDRRTAERLRRGQFPIEARIDLHGQTQAEAHRALIAFVTGSHKAGRRCVLVITGKGGPPGARRDSGEGVMPDRERGILRRAVPRWLNEPDLRPLILSFAQAQPAHGGAGAVYVLLRRKR